MLRASERNLQNEFRILRDDAEFFGEEFKMPHWHELIQVPNPVPPNTRSRRRKPVQQMKKAA